MKEVINILVDRIKFLENKLEEKNKELGNIINYLLNHNIVLTFHNERITSVLDEELESRK